MDMVSTDTEPCIESQLIDLSTVSMAVLRRLDTPGFRQSLRHVVERTAFHWLTETNSVGAAYPGV